MQFQSDILNVNIERASISETTSLGVVFLAGLAVGYWKDINEIKQTVSNSEIFKPKMSENCRNELYNGWKSAIKATQIFHK